MAIAFHPLPKSHPARSCASLTLERLPNKVLEEAASAIFICLADIFALRFGID